ncbi:hypothetical protein BDD43_0255 [Mucilaginibacter gracilis]|uniref:Uncharacterized protein n=1 Tax=Mucilaginibacter gracilis TaxID=423350 RepID=A0A495IWA8_9SPHI|nr:hypothetical protein BDD43_0255 [Mucilaginibacter gracilis]
METVWNNLIIAIGHNIITIEKKCYFSCNSITKNCFELSTKHITGIKSYATFWRGMQVSK